MEPLAVDAAKTVATAALSSASAEVVKDQLSTSEGAAGDADADGAARECTCGAHPTPPHRCNHLRDMLVAASTTVAIFACLDRHD